MKKKILIKQSNFYNNRNILILSILLLTVSLCASNWNPFNLARYRMVRDIDNTMSQYYKPNEPGAVALVCIDNEVVYRKAFGMADLQLDCHLEPEMLFKIGSMTKQFTAVAIMLLVEDGNLKLDDSIYDYLPEFPQKSYPITIEHLLTHTSGIKDFIDYKNIRNDCNVDCLIDGFKDEPLLFVPGSQMKYSNPGYVLLGKIIESVSGNSYQEFMTSRIFTPLGMNNTFCGDNSKIINGLASGYRKNDELYINAPYMSMTHPYSAGCLISNVDDLVMWYKALIEGRLISKEYLRKCFTPYTLNDGNKSDYGYGWYVNKFKEKYNIFHGGGVFGFVVHGMYLPQENAYIVLLSNRINPTAVPGTQGIAEMIAAIAIGDPMEIIDKNDFHISGDQLIKYAGKYYSYTNGTVNRQRYRLIMVENEKIYLGLNTAKRIEIKPSSTTEFFVKGVPGSIEFQIDGTGQVERFIQKRANGEVWTWIKE
ncbi:MAG: beta-lactamase family protein [Bacteroidales bacterium]|nr:beta-lactamase family protein [Bacteroidales bacterium]